MGVGVGELERGRVEGTLGLLSHIQCYLALIRAVNFNLQLLSYLLVLYTFIWTFYLTHLYSTPYFHFHLHLH